MPQSSFRVVMRLPGRTTATWQSVESYEEGVKLAERFLAECVLGEAPGRDARVQIRRHHWNVFDAWTDCWPAPPTM